jgi:beta-glucosidase
MAKRWGGRLDARPIDMRRIARGEAKLPGEDVVVLALGEPTSYTGERRGRARITLPEAELENLRTLKRGGKKIVSVVFAGRPVILDEVAWLSDAVVMAWYPGAMGAEALAEILCGETNPSGKLAQHIPLDVGQIPLSYREKRTFISCAYADIPAKPLYPFGYGLSYTTFGYSALKVAKAKDGLTATVKVTNTGKVAGDEVVQLYVRSPKDSGDRRVHHLEGFKRITLKPGESKNVSFALKPEQLMQFGMDGKQSLAKGEYTVFVGGGQPGFTAGVLSAKLDL